jgi:hypothetical protein
MNNELTAHLTTGAVIVYAIEWLKRWPVFRWLHADSTVLNRVVSACLAGVAAVGINWNFDATAGTLVITGLTWHAVALTGWEWLKQYVVQQVLYDGVIQKAGNRP